MIWLPKKAEADFYLVWRVVFSFTEDKAQICQPLTVINSVWYVCSDLGNLIAVFKKLPSLSDSVRGIQMQK